MENVMLLVSHAQRRALGAQWTQQWDTLMCQINNLQPGYSVGSTKSG